MYLKTNPARNISAFIIRSPRKTNLCSIKNLEKKIQISKEEVQGHEKEDILQNARIRKLLDTRSITELTRGIVVEMVDCIYVYEGKKIKIVYNFSDELESLFKVTHEYIPA